MGCGGAWGSRVTQNLYLSERSRRTGALAEGSRGGAKIRKDSGEELSLAAGECGDGKDGSHGEVHERVVCLGCGRRRAHEV